MKKAFGHMPDGAQAHLYEITNVGITAKVTDCGATLVSLLVPDKAGVIADVILGYESAEAYLAGNEFFGAVVGRNANRIGKSRFTLNGLEYFMTPNEKENNLHSGPEPFKNRLWQLVSHTDNSVCFSLQSPDRDQGFPGNAEIRVTYTLEADRSLHIIYDGVCDKDTIFNMTNHSYFNLAGHDQPQKAMEQILSLPARFFTPTNDEAIPTGQLQSVVNTPMDFRSPKPIGRDIDDTFAPLSVLGGYDHNFEVFTDPCAILTDPTSGRTMAVSTDCPGIQFYAGNFLSAEPGKDGMTYPHRSGVCLETQFYPDSIHNPQWPQPVTKAGTPYHSETKFRFSW